MMMMMMKVDVEREKPRVTLNLSPSVLQMIRGTGDGLVAGGSMKSQSVVITSNTSSEKPALSDVGTPGTPGVLDFRNNDELVSAGT